jgi:hypothetical protein
MGSPDFDFYGVLSSSIRLLLPFSETFSLLFKYLSFQEFPPQTFDILALICGRQLC